ncbi:MAG TPA: tetratricopeptide repeat protein, partial [Polyangiaceae bacterium]|nr:tetratricopeptide repeat protein [Polyangiaceae bacterium]
MKRTFFSCAALLLLARCGGEPREAVRSAPLAAPATVKPVEPPPLAVVEDAAPPSPEPETPPVKSVPPPLPATSKLARGTGAPADAALAAGDLAYEADDFARAEVKFKEALALAPKDAAPLVGLARIAIAKTNVPTDYNAAPRNPALEKAAVDLKRALKLDPEFAPAYTELGRVWLILGKADDALATLRKAVVLAPRDPEAHSGL